MGGAIVNWAEELPGSFKLALQERFPTASVIYWPWPQEARPIIHVCYELGRGVALQFNDNKILISDYHGEIYEAGDLVHLEGELLVERILERVAVRLARLV